MQCKLHLKKCSLVCHAVLCSALIRMICSWFGGCARGLSSPSGPLFEPCQPRLGPTFEHFKHFNDFWQFFQRFLANICKYLWQRSAQEDCLPLWATFQTLSDPFRANFPAPADLLSNISKICCKSFKDLKDFLQRFAPFL